MAGMGADVVIMEQASPMVKRLLGSAAYFFSAAGNADLPTPMPGCRLRIVSRSNATPSCC